MERSNVALMGFKNAPAHAQRFMDETLRDHADYAAAFIDDIIIFSETKQEHLIHLAAIFSLFRQRNVTLAPSKSFLAFPLVKLLGYLVNGIGLMNTEERVAALRRMKFPETLQHLEKWIGMVGWLRHLIPRFAARIAPLQDRKTQMLLAAKSQGLPLKGTARKRYTARADFTPTPAEKAAFQDVTSALMEAGTRHHFNPDKTLFILLDASQEHGLGAMAFHLADGFSWDQTKRIPATAVRPITFLSRTLQGGEPRYWPTELEVTCLVWVIRKLRTLVTSSKAGPVVALTDHAATIGIVQQKTLFSSSARANNRLIVASQWLSQFNLKVYHIPGTTNVVADAISRLPTEDNDHLPGAQGELDRVWDDESPDEKVHLFSEASIVPDLRQKILDGYDSDPKWHSILRQLGDENEKAGLAFTRSNGLLYFTEQDGRRRLCIPEKCADEIIAEAHLRKFHPGERRLWEDLNSTFAITRLARKVKNHVKQCETCRRNQTDRQKPHGEMIPIQTPAIPFHTIAMDFVVGLPNVDPAGTPWPSPPGGYFNVLLTVTDKFSKMCLLIPGNA